MKFGFGLIPQRYDIIAKNAAMVDAAGLDLIYAPDMPSTHRELITMLTVIAGNTSRVKLGSGVTNPLTRDPMVFASAYASLADYTNGRAFIGIGCGDSALHNSGLKPVKLAELEYFIQTLRSLFTTGKAVFHERKMILNWWQGGSVPIYVSAHGPRSLELAGRVGDGVIVGYGLTDSAIDATFSLIEKGARSAGRKLSDLDIWFMAHANLADDQEIAIDEIATILAVSGNLLTKHGNFDNIPHEHLASLRALTENYNYGQHAAASGASHNAELVKQLGLSQYLLERFGIAGTTEACIDRVRHLNKLGVENLWLSRAAPNCNAFIQGWGKDIIPNFRTSTN